MLPFMRFGPIHEVQKNDASYDANSDALAELRHFKFKLMRKPAFKAQVDTFTANAEVVMQLVT